MRNERQSSAHSWQRRRKFEVFTVSQRVRSIASRRGLPIIAAVAGHNGALPPDVRRHFLTSRVLVAIDRM
jgi:hypothetical protein